MPHRKESSAADGVKQRRARFVEIAREHPEWTEREVNALVRKELGAGVGMPRATHLFRKVRGIRGTKRRVMQKREAKAGPVNGASPTSIAAKEMRIEFARTVARKEMVVGDLVGLVRKRFGVGIRTQEASAILRSIGAPLITGQKSGGKARQATLNGGIVAAIQKLVAAVPGISSLTIAPDGSVEYTIREVVERRDRVRL